MFTLKLYTHGGSRRVLEVESFHVNAGPSDAWFEVTAYFAKPADDPENARRFDVGPSPYEPAGGRWDYGYIENAAGKTTEKLFPLPQSTPPEAKAGTSCPTDDAAVQHMVDRFLSWRLPKNLNPDNGISFKQVIYAGMSPEHQAAHWPVGTNLFDATQAREMVQHMLEGLPA